MLNFLKNNKWTVLKVFLDNPTPEFGFQLREISRITNLAPTSVKIYLNEFIKESLIIKKKQRGYTCSRINNLTNLATFNYS